MRVLFTCNPGFGHVHPMVPHEPAVAGAARRVAGEIAAMPGPDEAAEVLESVV